MRRYEPSGRSRKKILVPLLAKEGMKSGEAWRGIYFKDEKIGYAVTAQEQREEKFSVKEKGSLRLSVLGVPQNIEQTLEYQKLILEFFDFSLKSGLLKFQMGGRLEEGTSGAFFQAMGWDCSFLRRCRRFERDSRYRSHAYGSKKYRRNGFLNDFVGHG